MADPTDPEATTPLETDPEATTPLGTEPESPWEPLTADALRAPLPDRFERVEPLGEGGAGIVWLVEDRELGRRVALKVLGAASGHPIAEARFEREARTAARVRHENLVKIHDAGTHSHRMWIAMEAIDGGSMENWLTRSPRDARGIVNLVASVADALQRIHDAGIVHRDVKPGNILVTTEGVPKLTDFGLAHDMAARTCLTQAGATLGTPVYMAPEQIAANAGDITPLTDVYSLGAVLYRGLAGRPPHVGDTAAEVFRRLIEEDPEPPTALSADIPRDLETITLKAISRQPQDRYRSAAAFANDLRIWLEGGDIRARRAGLSKRAWGAVRRHPVRSVATIMLTTIIAWTISVLSSESQRSEQRDDVIEQITTTLGPARARLIEIAERQYVDDPSLSGRTIAETQAVLTAAGESESRSPGFAMAPYVAGRALAASGRFEDAAKELRRAVDRDPLHGPARLHLARALVMRALILNAEPGRPHRRTLRAEARASLTQRAHAVLDHAVTNGLLVDPMESALATAYVLLTNADDGAAKRLAAHCSASRARFNGRTGVEEFAFLEAYATLRVDIASQALSARPFWPEALFLRALAHRLKGQLAKAEADCTKLLIPWPDFAPARVLRSSVRYTGGRVEDARIDLERALAVDPKNVGAWTGLGLVHVRRRAFDDAIAALDAALAIDSADAQARVWRAEALSFLGRIDDGILEIDRAIALQPDLVDAWYDKSLMVLRRDTDRIDEARVPLEKVITLAKTGAKAVNARRNLCALHVMKGRPLEARRELDAIMQAYGRPEDAALLAGFVLEAEGKIPLAILALDKGLAARGDVAEYLFLRGRLRLDSGDDAGGLNDLRRALDLPLAVRVQTETGTTLHFYGRYLLNGCVTSIDARMAASPPARLTRRLDPILDRLDALLR